MKRKLIIKAATVLVAVSLLFQCLFVRVSAFAGGSGSAADPYLITTAEQLDAVRNNLSAHYKLAATIDLSSIANFKPIGTIAKPFKGSLKCDLNTDGYPLYAILNLNVHTAQGVYIDVGMSKWEAALFGAAENASFENIYVLDAKISNDNIGDNRGAVIYGDYKPGMDEMNSAALIGQATNCTVTGCGSTGVIDTKSNHSAGLIGYIISGTVQNSWSTMTVTSLGKWQIAGFIGTALDNAAVINCYATGNVEGTQSTIGAFIGSTTGVMVQNCYATGNARDGFIGRIENSTVANCYYSGTGIKGNNDTAVAASSIVNSYYLSGNPITHEGFVGASKAEIKSALSSIADFDTSGELPTLKNVKVPANIKDYKAGAVFGTPAGGATTQTPDNSQSSSQQGSSQQSASSQSGSSQAQSSSAAQSAQNSSSSQVQSNSSQNAATSQAVSSSVSGGSSQTVTSSADAASSQTVEALMSVEDLTELINGLPVADLITIEHKEDIKKALKAYESLSETDKDNFDLLVYKKLADSKKAVALFVVEEVSSRIEKLPEASKIDASHSEEINAILEDYNFLDEEYRTYIAEELRTKLDGCVKALESAGSSKAGAGVSAFTTTEIIIFAALALVILLNCASNIVMSIMLFRKKREQQLDGGSDYED